MCKSIFAVPFKFFCLSCFDSREVMAPNESNLAQAIFIHEQLLIAILPCGGKNREEDPKESNAFGCTIPLNKNLNTVPITISYNLSSVFCNHPSSRLPASWKLRWLLTRVQHNFLVFFFKWQECRPRPLSGAEALWQRHKSLHSAEKFQNATACCSATAPHGTRH